MIFTAQWKKILWRHKQGDREDVSLFKNRARGFNKNALWVKWSGWDISVTLGANSAIIQQNNRWKTDCWMSSFTTVPKEENTKLFAPAQSSSTQSFPHFSYVLPVSLFLILPVFFSSILIPRPWFHPIRGLILPRTLFSLSSADTFSTSPSCRAVGTSSACGPTGPSKGWGGFPCRQLHHSAQGSRRLYPGAGTSFRA